MNKLAPNINKMESGFAASVMLNMSQGWAVNKKARKKYMLSKFLWFIKSRTFMMFSARQNGVSSWCFR